jgi:hypothetical protein
MRKAILFIVASLWPFLLWPQNWAAIGNFNHSANAFAIDEENEVLYIGGRFNLVNDTMVVQGLCKYDGQQFTTIMPNAQINSFENLHFNILSIAFYQGHLYVVSPDITQFGSIEGVPVYGNIFRFNGETWETVFPQLAKCLALKVIDDKLYLLGSVGHSYNPVTMQDVNHTMGIFDGESLQIVPYLLDGVEPAPYQGHGLFWDIIKVEAGYILSADISHTGPLSGSPGMSTDIYFWNGIDNELQWFNNGFIEDNLSSPPIIAPMCITEYQNKIIVGGHFSSSDAQNVTSSNIAVANNGVWNSITAPSGSFNTYVQKMLVYDNKLWIVGAFSVWNQGPPPFYQLSRIAIYDGTDLIRPSNDIFVSSPTLGTPSIDNIILFRDTIYVAGLFQQISGEIIQSVAKYLAPDLSTSVLASTQSSFILHPNPSTNTIYLSSPDLTPGCFVRVYNLSGQLVYELNVLGQSERLSIATSNIGPPGMYVVQLHSPGKAMAVQKLVVAE